MPLVTVTMPVYNSAKDLVRAVESVLNQSFRDFEFLCVYDDSTDDTLAILERYAAEDSRMKILRPDNCRSHLIAMSIGIRSAVGKYIYTFESDDYLDLDLLELSVRRIEETGADAVASSVRYTPPSDISRPDSIGYYGDTGIVVSGMEASCAALRWALSGAALWNAEILKRIGIFEGALNGNEYSIRLWYHACGKVAFVNSFYNYNIEAGPMTLSRRFTVRHFDHLTTDVMMREFIQEHNYPESAQIGFEKDALHDWVDLSSKYYRYYRKLKPAGRKIGRGKLRKAFRKLNRRLWKKENGFSAGTRLMCTTRPLAEVYILLFCFRKIMRYLFA